MVERLEKVGLSFAAQDESDKRMEIIEFPSHPFFIGAQFHPELKSRPGKASPLFLGLIEASCGELETVMSPASAHQNVISNGTKNVFVNGSSKKATNGLADTDDEFTTMMTLPNRHHKPGTEPHTIHSITHHSNLQYVNDVRNVLSSTEFAVLENSYLSTVIKLAKMGNRFSAKLFHFFMQRRILTRGQVLWFSFADQPIRLQRDGGRMNSLEKVSLGAAIISEGIIVGRSSGKRIPQERLLKYRHYEVFSKLPWGKIGYEALSESILKMNAHSWSKERYDVQGFVWAIIFWSFAAVPDLGITIATPCETSASSDPLCFQWKSVKYGSMSKVILVEKRENVLVKTIIGESKAFEHLVQQTHPDDRDFDSVVCLVTQGYNMTREDWVRGEIDILVASGQIGNQQRRQRCANP
ncbi:unnamed protein product [Microthlaspi erraticum]|uniref:CTP synthase (glutamine hydrolyzing) n=1 Tax=Microthlaspi erraticum TaxID=1685480 RepID=A0A6D2JQQ3_9BRAS|nr:unnamed protein product [Microthlaspi erraticum]CAA7051767.1 unnamed protein product [Microthlaspi erraticum]